MDLIGEEHGRLERLAGWLDATRAELVGLAVLLCGAVVATGVLLWAATGPAAPAAEVSGIGAVVDPAGGDPTEDERGHDHAGAGSVASPDEEPTTLTVHVTGAVADPGLVVVDAGGRVADAIELAGGADADAELHRLNLARPLHDGEQVHVPVDGEDPPPEASQEATGGDGGGPVDLNRADAATLETLPGIGPARAQAIIEHRETHGPFAVPGDLREVPGIGEATFQRLADDVTTS